MPTTPSLPGGWLRLDGGDMLAQYWTTPFRRRDEATTNDHGPAHDEPVSPIDAYRSSISGVHMQWLNTGTGAAVILRLDGGWREDDNGGDWHVWWSPGEGRLPIELTQWFSELTFHRVRRGDYATWGDKRRAAITVVERDILGAAEEAS